MNSQKSQLELDIESCKNTAEALKDIQRWLSEGQFKGNEAGSLMRAFAMLDNMARSVDGAYSDKLLEKKIADKDTAEKAKAESLKKVEGAKQEVAAGPQLVK
jgi:hypothetical protein